MLIDALLMIHSLSVMVSWVVSCLTTEPEIASCLASPISWRHLNPKFFLTMYLQGLANISRCSYLNKHLTNYMVLRGFREVDLGMFKEGLHESSSDCLRRGMCGGQSRGVDIAPPVLSLGGNAVPYDDTFKVVGAMLVN